MHDAADEWSPSGEPTVQLPANILETWISAGQSLPEPLSLADPQIVALPSGHSVAIPLATVRFTAWAKSISINTWGNKPVLDVEGEEAFAEIAILRLFQSHGWDARWLETYAASAKWPSALNSWHPQGIRACEISPIGDPTIERVLRSIIDKNGGSCAGCWDILAWRGSVLICAEAKRARKDQLRETQKRWVEAALAAGLSAESFLIIEWQA